MESKNMPANGKGAPTYNIFIRRKEVGIAVASCS
jgi:hypothetical protein